MEAERTLEQQPPNIKLTIKPQLRRAGNIEYTASPAVAMAVDTVISPARGPGGPARASTGAAFISLVSSGTPRCAGDCGNGDQCFGGCTGEGLAESQACVISPWCHYS
jgi:hypothetical protein